MKHSWGILLFVVLVACSPSSEVISPTLVSMPTNNFPSSTAEVLPSEVVLRPENISTPAPIALKIEIIAPETRDVELSELGLSNTTRLILYYQPSDSLRIMSGQDIQPERIPNIQPQALIWSGVEISPNQKWFIYEVFTEKRDGIAYYDYWVSSIDGKVQRIVVSNVRGATTARWVTNEQVELWYSPDGARACPQRESIINPFTQEIFIPPDVPISTSPHCFYNLSVNPDRSKIFYRNQDNGLWNIYDFNTKQNQNVFPWLSETERFDLTPQSIKWLENGITLVIPHQDSIVFKVDLSVSDVSENDIILSKVLLPDGKKLYNETFSWWALENDFVGFDLINVDYDYSGIEKGSPSSNFSILDLKNSIWYDYYLDRAKTGENQKIISSFVFSSADNRFLAWTIYEPPDMSYASETVVLNRETGRIARIKGFEFFGWGEINQP